MSNGRQSPSTPQSEALVELRRIRNDNLWDDEPDFAAMTRAIETLAASSETSTLESLAKLAGWAGTVPAEAYLRRYIARTEYLAERAGKHPMGNTVKATASPYDPNPNAPKEYPGE